MEREWFEVKKQHHLDKGDNVQDIWKKSTISDSIEYKGSSNNGIKSVLNVSSKYTPTALKLI